MSVDNSKIYIREVGPREGVQSFYRFIDTNLKISLINSLSKCNFPEIEITSLVSPKSVPNMSDSSEIIGHIQSDKNKFSVLYLNEKGLLRALDLKDKILIEPWINFSLSETFLLKNTNRNFEESYKSVETLFSIFKANGFKNYKLMLSNSFGCKFEGLEVKNNLNSVLEKLQKLQLKHGLELLDIMLADTVGIASPKSINEVISNVTKIVPKTNIGLHLHDTQGLAIANAYEGLQMGVKYFDSSICGVGGCPFVPNAAGNIASEELVLLCESEGFKTGIDIEKLIDSVKLANEIFEGKIFSKLAKKWLQ